MRRLKDIFNISFDFENELQGKWVKNFILLFTELGSTLSVLIIISLIALLSWDKNVLIIFLPIYFFQLLIVEIIKIIFRKPRPESSHRVKNVFGINVSGASFPSGHTSNSFTLAFLITNYYNLNIFFIIITFVIAGAVSFSRILLGRHFIIDITAGAIIGLLLSVTGALMLPRILQYFL